MKQMIQLTIMVSFWVNGNGGKQCRRRSQFYRPAKCGA